MKKKSKKRYKKSSNIKKQIEQFMVILLMAVFIFYVLSTVYNLVKRPTDVFILENGTISLEEEKEGLIIREEYVIKGENYQNGMLQIKTEGERVAKGESIFRYYSQEEGDIKKQIAEVETKIKENIPNDIEKISSDIASLESQIKTKTEELYKVSDLQKIREIKRDINTYMAKKIEIISQSIDRSSELKSLIEKREEYENMLASNSEYINATVSGVVSYRVDGLEEQLKIDDFSYINKELINSINSKAGQIIATSEDKGKIINNFESYIAINSNSDASKNAKIGDKIEIQLSNAEKIDAQIEYIKMEDDESRTVILKITNKIEELVKYRKIYLTVIWWKTSGFKLPNSTIVRENDKDYVVKNQNGYTDKILVKVKRKNENYSIVENYNTDELKELGYSQKEINKMKELSLYDEIVINPTI